MLVIVTATAWTLHLTQPRLSPQCPSQGLFAPQRPILLQPMAHYGLQTNQVCTRWLQDYACNSTRRKNNHRASISWLCYSLAMAVNAVRLGMLCDSCATTTSMSMYSHCSRHRGDTNRAHATACRRMCAPTHNTQSKHTATTGCQPGPLCTVPGQQTLCAE